MHAPIHEYRLTEKGRDVWTVLAVRWTYGSQWLFDDEPTPGKPVDRDTGEEIAPMVIDAATGDPVDLLRTRLVARTSPS